MWLFQLWFICWKNNKLQLISDLQEGQASTKENIVLLSCKRFGRSCVTKLHWRLTLKKDEWEEQKTILVYILALNMNSVEQEKIALGIPFKYYLLWSNRWFQVIWIIYRMLKDARTLPQEKTMQITSFELG